MTLDYQTPQNGPDPKLTLGFVICCATGALVGAYCGLWLIFVGHPPLDVVAAVPFFAAPGVLIGSALTAIILRLVRVPPWGRIFLVTILGWAVAAIGVLIVGVAMYSSRLP